MKKYIIEFSGKQDFANALLYNLTEIITCKDCKHRILNENYSETDIIYNKAECELDTGDPYQLSRNAWDDNWFCADGEQKDEAKNE